MNLEGSRRKIAKMLGPLSAGLGLQAEAQNTASQSKPTAAPAATKSSGLDARGYPTVNRKNVMGIQVKAYAWLDEEIDKLLDNLQEKGNVNTVLAFTYLSDPTDIVTGSIPLPDHGTFGANKPPSTGGANYDYDMKYFRHTTLKDFRSPDDNHFNVIAEVGPK